MTHNIAKIRAALDLYDLPDDSYTGWAEVFEGAYSALAELEKAAAEQSGSEAWLAHYTTPPPAKPAVGVFTEQELRAAYIDGHDAAKYDTYTDRCASVAAEQFPYSDTFKLIQERAL